jgi:hypothetical protein
VAASVHTRRTVISDKNAPARGKLRSQRTVTDTVRLSTVAPLPNEVSPGG